MDAPNEVRTVRCPSCGGPSIYSASNAFRPFCSERCKTNDLSAWASERYAVPEGGQSGDVGLDLSEDSTGVDSSLDDASNDR